MGGWPKSPIGWESRIFNARKLSDHRLEGGGSKFDRWPASPATAGAKFYFYEYREKTIYRVLPRNARRRSSSYSAQPSPSNRPFNVFLRTQQLIAGLPAVAQRAKAGAPTETRTRINGLGNRGSIH